MQTNETKVDGDNDNNPVKYKRRKSLAVGMKDKDKNNEEISTKINIKERRKSMMNKKMLMQLEENKNNNNNKKDSTINSTKRNSCFSNSIAELRVELTANTTAQNFGVKGEEESLLLLGRYLN